MDPWFILIYQEEDWCSSEPEKDTKLFLTWTGCSLCCCLHLKVRAQSCVHGEKAFRDSGHHKSKTSGWGNLPAPRQNVDATAQLSTMSATGEAPHRWEILQVVVLQWSLLWRKSNDMLFWVVSSFRSPESVEMDEIMAAMVLTSLSCSPVVQSHPQTDRGPGWTHFSCIIYGLRCKYNM